MRLTVYGPAQSATSLVPVRRPPGPPPALSRPAGDLGDEHHRHRRQDHPRRGRPARLHGDWRGATERFLPDAAALRIHPGGPAPGDPPHRPNQSRSRPCSTAATPIGPTTVDLLPDRRGRPTGGWRAGPGPAPGRGAGRGRRVAKDDVRDSAVEGPKPGEPSTRRRSARADRAGTSNPAISMTHLGPSFDIHTGPTDLSPSRGSARPERGGDRGALRRHLAGLFDLKMSGAKMARSAGNIERVGEVLAQGSRPAPCAASSSRSTTAPPSTTPRLRWRRRARARPLDALSRPWPPTPGRTGRPGPARPPRETRAGFGGRSTTT